MSGAKRSLRELEELVLLDVDEPAGPVVLEDELVSLLDLGPGHRLRRPEAVADHLEDDVVAGHGEDDHHHSLLAPGRLEPVAGPPEVPEEVAVELGLAVLVVPERHVELGDRLPREDRLQEPDDPGRRLDVDVEVRAREAEDDRHVVLVEEDRVDHDPAVRVHEGEDEREEPLAADDPPDDVGPLVPVEDRLEELDEVEGRVAPGRGRGPRPRPGPRARRLPRSRPRGFRTRSRRGPGGRRSRSRGRRDRSSRARLRGAEGRCRSRSGRTPASRRRPPS